MEDQHILGAPRRFSDNNNGSPILNRNVSFVEKIPKRYILAVLAFFGFFFAYSLRANLSMAIVEMSLEVEVVNSMNTTFIGNHTKENLKWSPVLQGVILSSFFYGYILIQLPAGFLTNKYGGTVFFGAGIGICALLSLLIPFAARLGSGCVILLRILQGISQGFIFPSMHCLWSKWSPTSERSRLTTFAFSGSYVGTVCTMLFAGVIGKELNWESIFYIFGGLALIWSALWFSFIYESPAEHKTILDDERFFVESSIPHYATNNIPWKQILKSPAVWAIIAAHFAENWGFYTMLTDLPTFLSTVLEFKLDKTGVLSSIPYLAMAIALYSSGYLSDYLIEKRNVKCKSVRKAFCSIGLLIQCLFMIFITLTTNVSLIIIYVTIAVGFGGCVWASFGVNQLDIGAGYANVIMSVSNFFATIPGIISPVLTGHIISSNKKSDWNIVFFIAAIIFLFGSLIFALLSSGETQEWAISHGNYDDLNLTNKDGEENQNNTNKTDNVVDEQKIN